MIGPGTDKRTAGAILGEALELDPAPQEGPRADLERVGRELSIRPLMLILNTTTWSDADVRRVVEALGTTGASAGKLYRGAHLTAIVLHQGVFFAGGDELCLDVGQPSFSLVDDLPVREPALWAAYLHHRLAWETGGHFDRALEWNEALDARSVHVGRDDQLELELNRCSAAAWSSLPRATADAVRVLLRAPPSDQVRSRLRQELEQQRVLWRTGGVLRFVPWVARAVLLAEPTPPLRARLRWCLVCAPLRRELLGWCLDVEGYVRAHHQRDLGSVPESARLEWESFRNREPASDARYYPANSPAAPDGPFAFVELGGFLSSLTVSTSRHTLLHKLRMLRNYLAHGHYVSWPCIRELIELERGLGPGVTV